MKTIMNNTNTETIFTKLKMRQEYIDWISNEPTEYHLTITYLKGTSDHIADRSIKAFFHFLNQKIYTNRYYKRPDDFIKGFVSRERQKNGTLHYHSLIFTLDNRIPDYNTFCILIDMCLEKLMISHGSFKRITGDKGWELQEYSNDGDDDLECYVTKNFEEYKMTLEESCDSIGLLGKGRIEFGSKPPSID
jgi:hypothetical protein